jgi:AraC-like DNA-binding protein/GGDEF domain-containing protein
MARTVLGHPLALAEPDRTGPEGEVLVVLVDVDDFEVTRLARGDDWAEAMLTEVGQAVADAMTTPASSVARVPPDAWIVTLHGLDAAALTADGHRFAEQVRRDVGSRAGVEVTIGVSGAHRGPTRVEDATREAVLAMDRKLVDGGDSVYVYQGPAPGEPVPLPERVEEDLSRCIRDGDADGAVDALRAWIDRISRVDGVTPEVLRRWIAAELLYALDVAGRRRLADGSTDWIAAGSSLDEVLGMFEIHERSYLVLWLQRLLPRIVQAHAPRSPARHVLALVEQYIHDHYREDLRLVTVAGAVYVSPYYVSHLFQRELGTTFLKYLTAVRMQHARRLLEETDLPVETVAERVGYSAPKRFRVLFKRTFHVTPSDYRRQLGAASAPVEMVAVGQ